MARKRKVHVMYKRVKAAEGVDSLGKPYEPGPILLDLAIESWSKYKEREKVLKAWGYEVACVELSTNPDDIYSDYGRDVRDLRFW